MLFFALALALALLDWYAIWRQIPWLGYLTKPGVMLALLAGLLLVTEMFTTPQAAGRMVFFALGLLFMLLGDVLLMLPGERFTGGLLAFLIGHVAYILGFGGLPFIQVVIVPALLIGALVVAVSLRVFLHMFRALQASGHSKTPYLVGGYGLVLTGMLIAALSSLIYGGWHIVHAYLVAGGALLFYFSDIMLGWDRFVRSLEHARLKVRVTYHLGQLGIILGMTLRWLDML